MNILRPPLFFLLILLLGLPLIACEQDKQTKPTQQAEAIADHEECHLCGMQINHFAGPKGQVFGHGQVHSIKFCSTLDLFSWALQPENQARMSALYVHDMTQGHWEKPHDNPFIDAKTAWYVWGHKAKGAMGKTLASFATKEAAEQFSQENGGKVYRYGEVSLELLMNRIL